MSWISKQLSKRNTIIKKHLNDNPNYFYWKDYIDLEKYSSYIFITPRGIGKTHDGWKMVIDVYENSGEWTVWMRTKDTELKEIIKDYTTNRPDAWPVWAQIKGRALIDTRTGELIAKFVALSTVGNLASITGNGCFGIFYDEFLKRTGSSLTNGFRMMVDFIRTLERKHLLTVILSANATTFNSNILNKLDLWMDKPEVDDEDRRLMFRYITEWENPPKVELVSTASLWAQSDDALRRFMENADVLDDTYDMVLPFSRLGPLRYIEQYVCDDVEFTLALTNENKYVLVEGAKMKNAMVNILTTEDGFRPKKGYVRPFDINLTLNKIVYALEIGNLLFTSFELKDILFKLLITLKGKIQRKRL